MSNSINVSRKFAEQLASVQQFISSINVPIHVWVSMVLLTAAALCYSMTLHMKAEYQKMLQEHQAVAAELKQLDIENIRLSEELEEIDKDPRTIEVLARQAGMVASDEAVVLLKKQPVAEN